MRSIALTLSVALFSSIALAADAPIDAADPKPMVLPEIRVPGTPPPQKPHVVVVLPRAQEAKKDVNASSDQHLNDSLRKTQP